jgi:hypothetical protein
VAMGAVAMLYFLHALVGFGLVDLASTWCATRPIVHKRCSFNFSLCTTILHTHTHTHTYTHTHTEHTDPTQLLHRSPVCDAACLSDLVNRLRSFDAYPKTLEDFRIKTFSGAAGSLIRLPSSLTLLAMPFSPLSPLMQMMCW